jgi:LAO/AO transport system kinase
LSSAPTAADVRAGGRRALARAITLVESTLPEDRRDATALLDGVIDATGGAVRLGISGPPGVGKSTFIEAFGSHLTSIGHRVAVLAVDPSSSRSGGSILGDKTRMERLAANPDTFIRPSPSRGELGGVARRTREALLLCEAAGFDVVVVETVGVGQSELAVGDMVDLFVLLASPGAGDELQGIKRGIMELADLVVVTKADGDLAGPARHAAADLANALHLLRPRHPGIEPQVLLASSVTGEGVAEAWTAIERMHEALQAGGHLDALRAKQAKSWLWSEVSAGLLERAQRDARVAAELPRLEADVAAGTLAPGVAARRLLDRLDASPDASGGGSLNRSD